MAGAAPENVLLQRYVETFDDPLFIKDANHLIVAVNAAYCAFVGRPAEIIVGTTDAQHLDDAEWRTYREKDELVLRTGQANVNVEELTSSDGVKHTIVTTKKLFRDLADAPLLACHFRDVTETVDLERKAARNERLAYIGRLSASVAHELRNPLGTMSASLYLLVTADPEGVGAPGTRQRRVVDRMRKSVSRCVRIIDELLDFSADMRLELQDTDLGTWAAAAARELSVDLSVRIDTQVETGCMAVVDRERLRRALVHLITNARSGVEERFSDAGEGAEARVRVRVTSTGARHSLTVEDDGCGMSAEVLGQARDPMFSTKSFGVGLGLPLVVRIVEQHGGTVQVDSIAGSGSTVRIELPSATARAAVAPAR